MNRTHPITSFSFDIKDKIKQLIGNIITKNERKELIKKLKNITLNCLKETSAYSVKNTLKKIDLLKNKQEFFNKNKDVKTIPKIISDCKMCGTIPFAILARHGFIAKACLFMKSAQTIIGNV